MTKLVCCVVGSLMGDAWMKLPAVIDLCKTHTVDLVAGTYALPVWNWAQNHVIGADYTISHVLDDPDDGEHKYCPGWGYHALTKALEDVRAMLPGETVEMPGSYERVEANIQLKDVELCDGENTIVHPYTKHIWKNIEDIITKCRFARPVRVVGLPEETQFLYSQPSWKPVMSDGFDAMVKETLRAAGVVSILSAWGNLAALFKKRQIVVSFTPDVPNPNPRATILIKPTVPALQVAINEAGL